MIVISRSIHLGPIPSSFEKLIHLSELDLNSNFFTSSVPSSLNNLTLVAKLNVCNNRLTGQLPNFYKTSFLEFYACRNNFYGTIPTMPGTSSE